MPRLRDAVAICLRDSSGRWLVVRRAENVPAGGMVGFPAGKLEAGETQQEAVEREAYEELGITVRPVRLIVSVSIPELGTRLHAWAGHCDDYGSIQPDPREIAEVLWLPAHEIVERPDGLRSGRLITPSLMLADARSQDGERVDQTVRY